MKEEIKLIVVLAQESRHIVETCGMKLRPARRETTGMRGSVQWKRLEKDVLLI